MHYFADMYKDTLDYFWRDIGQYGFSNLLYVRNYRPAAWHSEALYHTLLERLSKYRCGASLENPDFTKRFEQIGPINWQDFIVDENGKYALSLSHGKILEKYLSKTDIFKLA